MHPTTQAISEAVIYDEKGNVVTNNYQAPAQAVVVVSNTPAEAQLVGVGESPMVWRRSKVRLGYP